LFVDFDANLSLTNLLADFLLNCLGDVSSHIVSTCFGSGIGIIAIILNVLVVLSFAIHGRLHLHGVLDG